MNTEKLSKEIEAILFYRGIETSFEYLKKQTSSKKEEVLMAMSLLEERLKNSALTIVANENKYLLAVSPENTEIIKKIKGHEEYGELSKFAIETLAIVLYKSPISRFDIDNIRGVNSSYSLRNLSVRGLVEVIKENGSNLYIPTVDTFSYLGISSKDKLPGFAEVQNKLDKIEREAEKAEETVFDN